MKLRWFYAIALTATALLTGCASVREVNSTVQSYSTLETLPTPPAYKLELLPSQKDEIHFGATVTFKNVENNSTQTFQLVGVDEANIAQKKLSFTTPLAKALLHKKAGDHGILDLGAKRSTFKILKIEY